MSTMTGTRGPESEAATLGHYPNAAAECSSPENSQTKRKSGSSKSQGREPATLRQVVDVLNDPAMIGARLCAELWGDDKVFNGAVVQWLGEQPRHAHPRDLARLRLRLEDLGIHASPELIHEALMCLTAAPAGMTAECFLHLQGDLA